MRGGPSICWAVTTMVAGLPETVAKQSVADMGGKDKHSFLQNFVAFMNFMAFIVFKSGWRGIHRGARECRGCWSRYTHETHTDAHASTHTRARAQTHILRPRSLVPRRPSRWPFFCWSGETRPAIEEPRDCTVTRSVSTHEPARGGRPVECSALLSTCRRSWPPATRGPGPCMCAICVRGMRDAHVHVHVHVACACCMCMCMLHVHVHVPVMQCDDIGTL